VIVRRVADRRVDRARQRGLSDPIGAAPAGRIGFAVERAVAGEGELAPGRPRRAFVDDAADARREGGVADTVQHDLGNRSPAGVVLASSFVINGAGEALEGLLARV